MWSLPRRVAFRFGFVFAVLLLYTVPLALIPKAGFLAELANKPWEWGVAWFAEHVLGIEAPSSAPTGSGDTLWNYVQLLLAAILAAIGALAWSVLDRRRLAYPRLQAAAVVGLRYFLVAMMCLYGIVKVFSTQFPAPSLARYDQSVGEMSPMGLLWTFMGHSQAYTLFSGLAELTGGLLLLSRRTSVLGALVTAAVMTNVVMLNFCYDVPVKLFSMQLLLCALLLLAPHLRRLIAAALGHAVREDAALADGPLYAGRRRLVAKGAFLACLLFMTYESFARWRAFPPPPTALHGTWAVATFTADGVDRPPLLTDELRWRKLIVTEHAAQIRRMTDKREWYRGSNVDDRAKTLTLATKDTTAVLHYQRPDADHLVLDGELDGKRVHVTLEREPLPLLPTRGFHWVQELPFNR